MDIHEMERQHQSGENLVLGYLTGRTLKNLSPELLFDSDLEPIRDDELYCISMNGVHKVDD